MPGTTLSSENKRVDKINTNFCLAELSAETVNPINIYIFDMSDCKGALEKLK